VIDDHKDSSLGPYTVCATGQGNPGGFASTLKITSSKGGEKTSSGSGTNSITTPELCVDAGAGSTNVTFTVTIVNSDSTITRPSPAAATKGVTSTTSVSAFDEPYLTRVDYRSPGDFTVCATGTGNPKGFNSTVTISNNKNNDTKVVSGSGNSAITTDKLCVNAGAAYGGVWFAVQITNNDPSIYRDPGAKSDQFTAAGPYVPPACTPSVSVRDVDYVNGRVTVAWDCMPAGNHAVNSYYSSGGVFYSESLVQRVQIDSGPSSGQITLFTGVRRSWRYFRIAIGGYETATYYVV
jgi:hypothetical protein